MSLGLLLQGCVSVRVKNLEKANPPSQTTSFGEVPAHPGCESPLDKAATESLAKMAEKASLTEGSIFFDLVAPKSEAEAKAFNQMAVFAVRFYSSNGAEVPFSKLLWASGTEKGRKNQLAKLPEIFPKFPTYLSPTSEAALGLYRSEGYFFIPLKLLEAKGEVFMALKNPAQTLKVVGFPIPGALQFKVKDPDPKKAPDPKLIVPLILKRYCLN